MKTASEVLVIIDVINGFVYTGALADPSTAHIIPGVEALAKDFISQGKPVIAFRDAHTANSAEFSAFPPHCIIGTGEEELVPELKALESDMIVLDKNATSAFTLPAFRELIADMPNLEKVTIVGLCTDICVMNLAIPLKNHYNEINKNVAIIAPKDLCDTYHIEGVHDKDEWNTMAHRFMAQAGVEVPDTVSK